ncbi:MAG: 16S rRNA (cytidine(1402)-2'-O)-methyltransferase [Reinekea sp.]
MADQQWVSPGILYVVSTPIGNLADITERAVKTLQQVDLVCCEDTRNSGRLMDAIGCRRELMSLHEHNEAERAAAVIDRLKNGQSIALISDAGTPLISDPGFVLVNEVVGAGLSVVPVPGVSAVITALSVAGLPTDRWYFEGFLPHKTTARQKALAKLVNETATTIFYESSHRIEESLRDMQSVFGEQRPVVVARELTKTFETFLRGDLASVLEQVQADGNQRKGEFVILLAGAQKKKVETIDEQAHILAMHLKPLLPPKKAAAVLADVFGGSKKTYYEYLLQLG